MKDDIRQYIEGLDVESRILYAENLLGEDAKGFLASDLGRTLVGFAQQEYVSALLALETVNPRACRRIQTLQNQAKVSRQFCSWLRDLISQGQQAEDALKEPEE